MLTFLLLLAEILEQMYITTSSAILINLASHFPARAEIDAVMYRQQKFAELRAIDQETLEIITQGTKLAPETLSYVLDRVIREDFKDIQLPPGITPGTRVQEMLTYLAETAESSFNMVNTQMRESASGVFISGAMEASNELNRAAVEAVIGMDARKASLAAVTRMSEQGITGYIDRLGRHWTPEAYVNMVTRTTLHNAQVQGRFSLMGDMRTSVFQVSSHLGARPLCAPYQGKFYSTDHTSGTVYDLDGNMYRYEPLENTSYGEPAGLFGINCGHFPIPFVSGFSRTHAKPIETAQQKKANEEQYQRFQNMRAQERNIRAVKTEEMMFRASGNTAAAKAKKDKADEMMDNYKAWCEDNGMTPRPQRTSVAERRADELQSSVGFSW